MSSPPPNSDKDSDYVVPPFYQRFKSHLSSYFKHVSHLEKVARTRGPKEGGFLRAVNKEILTHVGDETFDTRALSEAMALSRSQLYRRIFSLTGLPPSRYIRFLRLQKAKELMEKESLTVGEAAFRTGFVNLSHFARVFRKEFGLYPSEFKKRCQDEISANVNKGNAT